MHVKCQSGKKCIFRRCFKIYLRYTHCVTIITEIPRRVQVHCRKLLTCITRRLIRSHCRQYDWQRYSDSSTRDSYTCNNSTYTLVDNHVSKKNPTLTKCHFSCIDNNARMVSTCNVLLLTLCKCVMGIHNIITTCRKTDLRLQWNFLVTTKFCQIIDNLRHVN